MIIVDIVNLAVILGISEFKILLWVLIIIASLRQF